MNCEMCHSHSRLGQIVHFHDDGYAVDLLCVDEMNNLRAAENIEWQL